MKAAFLMAGIVLAMCAQLPAAPEPDASPVALDPSFLQHCAFVSVDVQEPGPRTHVTEEKVSKLWKQMGFTADDVNAATDYAFDVAYPNARRVTDACRSFGLSMIFIHWGCLFRDGMDLDPEIRREFLGQFGPAYDKWGHCLGDPTARPAAFLGVRDGEYVIPKSGQDAFTSSNLKNVLTNLGVKNIVFIGGHTGACLGKTARSAKRLGFRTLCVEDATFDARQSTRRRWIDETGYDYVVTTEEFLALRR
ncbi:MAG: isochorismatase family protein [Opitutaceae bacterium]|nr:isochorismatase family protein [Opitutaceae bacterium]